MSHYFQSYDKYFWQWEDNMEVIAIPNGNTIAYRAYVVEVLEALAPQGLPPFGSLMLAIMATNPGGKEDVDTFYSMLYGLIESERDTRLSSTIQFLKLLSDLPEPYKKGNGRLSVFSTIFQNAHGISSLKKSKEYLGALKAKIYLNSSIGIKQKFEEINFDRDLKPLYLLNEKFKTVDQIIEKIAELPGLNEEIKIDEFGGDSDSNQEEKEDLIDLMMQDPKTFHVGALVRRIWSGLNIPVHSSLPSQQPIGGVSDISNKGSFDKLLVSEFANDDLVFLSRLANNEALYIRREVPPSKSKHQRIFLVDISLKNWGTPKAIAFATMLAIAKHPKSDFEVLVYAIGNTVYPLQIDSIHTIIDSLQLLDGTLNPVNGMNAFFKDFKLPLGTEVFLFTEPTVLKQSSMARALSEYQSFIKYMILSDAEGSIDVYRKQQASRKHVQHIQLPLKELWAVKVKKKSNIKEESTGKEINFPVLFSNTLNERATMLSEDGHVFQVTVDRALIRLHDKDLKPYQKGWEMIFEGIEYGNTEFEVGSLDNGYFMLLAYNVQKKLITLYNTKTKEKVSLLFEEYKRSAEPSFYFQKDKFVHVNAKGVWTFDLNGLVESQTFDTSNGTSQKSRKELLAEANRKIPQPHPILKKVREVYINIEGNIVFNTHEFLLKSQQHIKLENRRGQEKMIDARMVDDNQFVFPDESVVEINRNGMLILKSSGDVPNIYIPSVLDVSLGVATEKYFSGNSYYQRNPHYKIIVEDLGGRRLEAIKLIRMNSIYGLHDISDSLEKLPRVIFTYLSEVKALEIKSVLEAIGVKVCMIPTNGPEEIGKQLTLAPKQFFEQCIYPFISHIMNHGTKN